MGGEREARGNGSADSGGGVEMEGEVRKEIIVGGTPDKWVGPPDMTYEQAREEWRKVRDNQEVAEGAPITWKEPGGESGILRPGQTVKVEDGLELKVDAGHLS